MRSTWRILLCAACLALAMPASACINTFASEIMEARGTGDKKLVADIVARAEADHRKEPTLANTNDLAVAYIVTGRNAEGIALLRELEQRYPGSAIVAANLGTALELSGQDEEALRWIRESVRRDPREHEGSEWVHVKILEAKLAMTRDPNWLRRNSVIGWREGDRLPLDEQSRPRPAASIVRAIEYQLQERTQFVDAPDANVGDLYLSLGDMAHSVSGAVVGAWERDGAISSNYHSALHYGTVHEDRARERLKAADARIEAARPAMQAAAKRDQEVREAALRQAAQADQRKAELRKEQQRRRLLALGAFSGFAVIVALVVFLRMRRRAA